MLEFNEEKFMLESFGKAIELKFGLFFLIFLTFSPFWKTEELREPASASILFLFSFLLITALFMLKEKKYYFKFIFKDFVWSISNSSFIFKTAVKGFSKTYFRYFSHSCLRV